MFGYQAIDFSFFKRSENFDIFFGIGIAYIKPKLKNL